MSTSIIDALKVEGKFLYICKYCCAKSTDDLDTKNANDDDQQSLVSTPSKPNYAVNTITSVTSATYHKHKPLSQRGKQLLKELSDKYTNTKLECLAQEFANKQVECASLSCRIETRKRRKHAVPSKLYAISDCTGVSAAIRVNDRTHRISLKTHPINNLSEWIASDSHGVEGATVSKVISTISNLNPSARIFSPICGSISHYSVSRQSSLIKQAVPLMSLVLKPPPILVLRKWWGILDVSLRPITTISKKFNNSQMRRQPAFQTSPIPPVPTSPLSSPSGMSPNNGPSTDSFTTRSPSK